jgi:hypothetical protein
MSKGRFALNIFASTLFLLALTTVANAQATRTWVSGVGDDVNPCSRTAPCKTFAGAISKTAAGGEIDCLDPGGFGTLTATKSITIDGTNGAGFGSTLAAGTTGFTINDSLTGTPGTIVVRLRNLSINGAGTGTIGINFVSGKAVEVENCRIFQFQSGTGDGIRVANTTGDAQLVVRDTIISDCLNDGIDLSPANAAGVSATLDANNVSIYRTGNGVTMQTGTTRATINRSSITLAAGPGNGINLASGSPVAHIDHTNLSHNTKGINVVVGTANIGDSYITNCSISMSGNVHSWSDNKILDNGTNTLPTQDLTKH